MVVTAYVVSEAYTEENAPGLGGRWTDESENLLAVYGTLIDKDPSLLAVCERSIDKVGTAPVMGGA